MVVFLCFGSYILQSNFKIKISSNVLTKLRLENFWKLPTAIINRPMSLQLIFCHKKELLSSLSSIKLMLIRNKCYKQGWQYGTVRYVGTLQYALVFANKYGTLVRDAFL